MKISYVSNSYPHFLNATLKSFLFKTLLSYYTEISIEICNKIIDYQSDTFRITPGSFVKTKNLSFQCIYLIIKKKRKSSGYKLDPCGTPLAGAINTIAYRKISTKSNTTFIKRKTNIQQPLTSSHCFSLWTIFTYCYK